MKILFNLQQIAQFCRYTVGTVKEFLETELSIEVKQTADSLIAEGDYSQAEIFSLGCSLGREIEKSHWTKPDEFWLAVQYCELLKQAIKQYQKESYMTVDSIKIEETEGSNVWKVVVSPTQIQCLFNVFNNYGQLVKESELSKQVKQSM